jgi:hypothetical protein
VAAGGEVVVMAVGMPVPVGMIMPVVMIMAVFVRVGLVPMPVMMPFASHGSLLTQADVAAKRCTFAAVLRKFTCDRTGE